MANHYIIIAQGSIPRDGTPLKVIHVQPLPLIVVYYTVASLGIIFTIICFLFNVTFRKRKSVYLKLLILEILYLTLFQNCEVDQPKSELLYHCGFPVFIRVNFYTCLL